MNRNLVTDNDEAHEEWQVSEIVDCRETKRYGLQYKARFTGDWDEWNASPPWQPWTDFKHAIDKILDYHDAYPNKPKPPEFFFRTTNDASGDDHHTAHGTSRV